MTGRLLARMMPHSDGLEARVLHAFRARHWTLASAESLTGGLFGARVTRVPGAGDVFLGSIVVYSDDAKTRALGIDAALVERLGAVSRDVAREMAIRSRDLLASDVAVSFTGFAGPNVPLGGELGRVLIAIAGPGGIETHDLRFGGSREEIREACVDEALRFLLALAETQEKRASKS